MTTPQTQPDHVPSEGVETMAALYEWMYEAVPEAARRFASETWGETWAHAEMGSLMDFASLATALSSSAAADRVRAFKAGVVWGLENPIHADMPLQRQLAGERYTATTEASRSETGRGEDAKYSEPHPTDQAIYWKKKWLALMAAYDTLADRPVGEDALREALVRLTEADTALKAADKEVLRTYNLDGRFHPRTYEMDYANKIKERAAEAKNDAVQDLLVHANMTQPAAGQGARQMPASPAWAFCRGEDCRTPCQTCRRMAIEATPSTSKAAPLSDQGDGR
jgi:hypothetical protein